ncbi:hypothetical protein [Desertivibrio insolitus]|uniref:hypothetical protein n=1 Tax=Herbiconiux sp. SYSU D00978 TaxID=2812562 RepID=UPI001A9713C4|nr:hypothetical protein [Herbiconiux sp. SYSU D00978]
MPRVRAFTVVLATLVMAGLTACAPSPKTTYTDESGREITVDWADYPGAPGLEPDEVLGSRPYEDVAPASEALLADARAALGGDLGWTASGEDFWYEHDGNGYGGRSWYRTFNSVTWVADSAPEDWNEAVRLVSEVTTAHGLGPLQLDHEVIDDPDYADALREEYGTENPDEYWFWAASASRNAEWFFLSFVDVDRAATAELERKALESNSSPRSVTLGYGATSVPPDELRAFTDALEPFEGLERPAPTTSD